MSDKESVPENGVSDIPYVTGHELNFRDSQIQNKIKSMGDEMLDMRSNTNEVFDSLWKEILLNRKLLIVQWVIVGVMVLLYFFK